MSLMEAIISKVSALQIWLSHRRISITFSNTFLCLVPNIEKKGIPLDDDIVSCKNSIVPKDLTKIGGFFLLSVRKYVLAANFYYSVNTQRFSLPLVILDMLFRNNIYLLGVRFFLSSTIELLQAQAKIYIKK